MKHAKASVLGVLLGLGCTLADTAEDPPMENSADAQVVPVLGVVPPAGGARPSPPPSAAPPDSKGEPTASAESTEQLPTPVLQPALDAPAQAQDAVPEPEQTTPADEASAPTPVGAFEPAIPAVTEECPAFQTGTLTFMGLSGIQIVAGAKPAAPTAPMVFYWHGTGSTSGEFSLMAGAVRSGVEVEGGILVSFQGTTGGDALSGTSVFGRSDLQLVDQLVACAVRDHNVDPRRIFTTGCSAGGLFATNLAALRSQYIAAAAPNSGGMTFPQQFASDYTPALMTVHGAPGRDVVVVDFSNTSATADRSFSGRGGFVIDCNHGGGHCGGAGLAGDIWQFFEAHPYGVEPAPSPWTSGLPSGFSGACEIF
jgi:acetyl esterase/lipase